ncbi:MAG: hypothetical protein R3F45_10030 [Gammaproteobacteria bacterium]
MKLRQRIDQRPGADARIGGQPLIEPLNDGAKLELRDPAVQQRRSEDEASNCAIASTITCRLETLA